MNANLTTTTVEISDIIDNNIFLSGLATRYRIATPISFETWDNLNLTYQFRETEKSPEHSTAIRWNENIGTAAENVFSQIANITNLTFTKVTKNADIDLGYKNPKWLVAAIFESLLFLKSLFLSTLK